MQEEVEQRIVSLMISCGKLGEQEFRKAVAKLLEQLKSDHQKHQYSKANPHGKMTVKQLAAKDKGLQSIEVTDQNMSLYNTGTRTGLIAALEEMRGYLAADETELRELTDSAIAKLRRMSDAEYDALDLFPDFEKEDMDAE